MAYSASWESLCTHTTPKWLRDAKFGIYTHWGIYSVPGFGPNCTWYPHNMYKPGNPQYEHHVRTYGGPSRFGYKDFIPMFTGEKFDAAEWAYLFRRAGARFAGPVGEHHDGFTMWDTAHNDWNAAKMGPKTDVVGDLEKAVRGEGMRFMVALHHAEHWFFYPHWEPDYDTSDPSFAGLYGAPHNLELPPGGPWGFESQSKPSKEFLDTWLAKVKEVVDRYEPDLLWFDFGLGSVQEHYKLEALAHYYNRAEEWGREAITTYKWHHLAPGAGLVDLELGRYSELTHHEWLTDSTVDDGEGWGYLKETKYKSASTLVHYLVDNVSKNGYLLLNVGPKPNGEIPAEVQDLLLEIGAWLEVNGEAIYGSRPWMTYGEGPTSVVSGYFGEAKGAKPFASEDIRFTVKGDTLYAICLGLPGSQILIRSVAGALYPSEVSSVQMLGLEGDLPYSWTHEGLLIALPEKKPCKHACAIRINRVPPFRA